MMFKFGGFNMQTNDDYEGYTDEYSNRLDELLGLNENITIEDRMVLNEIKANNITLDHISLLADLLNLSDM